MSLAAFMVVAEAIAKAIRSAKCNKANNPVGA